MQPLKTHIVVLNGTNKTGKKTLSFELALALLYNNQKTALMLSDDSSLRQTLQMRKKDYLFLPAPEIISRNELETKAEQYDAVIIPNLALSDNLILNTATFITLLTPKECASFKKNLSYINTLWELKKKIAATYNRSLNWVVCENNTDTAALPHSLKDLEKISRMYGFRNAPPLSCRDAYKNNVNGLCAQDKTSPQLSYMLTYEDICAKREIIKLAEFIFSA